MPAVRIIITGAKGQLGTELLSMLKNESDVEVIGLGREELDITSYNQVKKKMLEIMPDIIIHAAAYTNVDMAEEDSDKAFLVNGIGTRNLAKVSSKIKAKFVYISTDYVFSGSNNEPIEELEAPSPLSVYGQTKLAGEYYVKKNLETFFIVRTSWIYGRYGKNFVKSMLELSEEKGRITVVDDQIGSPTYTVDLAQCIMRLIFTEKYGVYHVTNSGSCSWYEFAKAIFEEANIEVDLVPCKTEEFPRKAPRPCYSVLNDTMLRKNGFPKMRNWRDALKNFLHLFLKDVTEENDVNGQAEENLTRAGEVNGYK
ncbi:dTDP-4-dehydrorhamnose reductase [Peribacillus sp. SCS-155]|uniref:dTDP-4-dehydrorhamnose reductase n=1 Tax=Peribacillus sedimenti TaxID=3115297 RepID=UPI0039059FAD